MRPGTEPSPDQVSALRVTVLDLGLSPYADFASLLISSTVSRASSSRTTSSSQTGGLERWRSPGPPATTPSWRPGMSSRCALMFDAKDAAGNPELAGDLQGQVPGPGGPLPPRVAPVGGGRRIGNLRKSPKEAPEESAGQALRNGLPSKEYCTSGTRLHGLGEGEGPAWQNGLGPGPRLEERKKKNLVTRLKDGITKQGQGSPSTARAPAGLEHLLWVQPTLLEDPDGGTGAAGSRTCDKAPGLFASRAMARHGWAHFLWLLCPASTRVRGAVPAARRDGGPPQARSHGGPGAKCGWRFGVAGRFRGDLYRGTYTPPKKKEEVACITSRAKLRFRGVQVRGSGLSVGIGP